MTAALMPTLTAALLLCGACASTPNPPSHTRDTLVLTQPIVLFGEVHDNAAQHALRLASFEALLHSGARPALLLEQFDRERQPAIDALRAGSAPPDADAVIAAGSGAPASDTRSWQWPYYRPLIALALRYELPIVAANVSRDAARRVMNEGLASAGFDPNVPPEIERAQSEAIESSHCGLLNAEQAKRMSLAQVARDQFMARSIEAQAGRGVVLLAGNGHVRTDVGVPRWLSPATRARSESIGLLEGDGGLTVDDTRAYDRVLRTPVQVRKNPCGATS